MRVQSVLALLAVGAIGGCAFKYPGDYVPDGGPPTCNNDQLDQGEDCDGTHFGDATCVSEGFGGGTLGCTAGCSFDTSGCTAAAVPSVPTPRLPMNDAYLGTIHTAGTMQPRFAWEPSTWSGAGQVKYDLQLATDRAFTTDVTTVSGTATSYRPANDLPVRTIVPVGTRYYWRVRACVDTACSAYSRTRWVNVGRSDHDLNGDGFADVVIASNGASSWRVQVFFGSANAPLQGTANGTLNGAASEYAQTLDISPDLNADGFSDLAIGAPSGLVSGHSRGKVYVYFGKAGAIFDASPGLVLAGHADDENFGFDVTPAGDVNGDGFEDLAVGTRPAPAPAQTKVYIYQGGLGGSLDNIEDEIVTGNGQDGFGSLISSAGDLNGDGFGDLAVSGRPAPGGMQNVLLFPGSASGLGQSSGIHFEDSTQTADPNDLFETIADAGDLNGDGFSEVIAQVHTSGTAHVNVYYGASTLAPSLMPGATISSPSSTLGSDLDSLADTNMDGYADILVGDFGRSGQHANAGAAYVFLGGAGQLDTTPDGSQAGSYEGANLGFSVAGAGDVNGDGHDDFVIGSPGGMGKVYLHLGSAVLPPDLSAAATISGTSASEALGYLVD